MKPIYYAAGAFALLWLFIPQFGSGRSRFNTIFIYPNTPAGKESKRQQDEQREWLDEKRRNGEPIAWTLGGPGHVSKPVY